MKITFNSPVILIFSSLCVAAYLLSNVLHLFTNAFTLFPVWDGSSLSWYFSLFSYSLGHADMNHLIGNLSFILLLGPIIEKRYGAKKLVFMILATTLVTALLHITFFNHGLLGASGIVFMLILLTPLANFSNKQIPLTFILIVIIFIGKELMGSFQEDNISHFAHIMGGIVGAVFGFMFNKNNKAKQDNSMKLPLT